MGIAVTLIVLMAVTAVLTMELVMQAGAIGEVPLGSIGSELMMSYTVMGDTLTWHRAWRGANGILSVSRPDKHRRHRATSGPSSGQVPSHHASAACGQPPRRAYPAYRSCGRVAEGGGLLNRYRVVKPYRGFESLRLRQ